MPKLSNAMAAGIGWLGRRLLLWRHPASQGDNEQSGRGTPSTPPSPQAKRAGHETEDMSGALMGRLAAGLGAALGIVIALMFIMLDIFHREDRAGQPKLTAEQSTRLLPPAPHLQVNAVQDLATLLASETSLLHHYAWIDPGRRRARIPINRAMTLAVGQKLDSAP